MRAAKEAKPGMKEVLSRASSPGTKKRGKVKYEPETMIIMPAVPTESVAQYSLAIPSANKDRLLDEMDMLRNITGNLNEIVSTMEGVYAKSMEAVEEGEEEEEEPTAPKEDYEDMTSFLICCSQLNNQLESALREEKQILESLLKWFEKEVQEMEEISVEQLIPDWEIPVADKNIMDNISKLLNRIQRLEELKGRVQELPKLIQLSAPKQEKRRPFTPAPPTQKDPKNIIEELAMKHATEDVMNMVQVFQDDTGQPQTIEMMNNRMVEIMKVFERQTNKLHRVANEQDVLEGKLQKIQQEFRKLAEEKQIMEDELQKMKGSEQQEKSGPDTRKKMLPKIEKVKVEEKPPAAPERVQTLPSRQKEHLKMKDDLAKAQANIQSLENEKKMLEEKLQKALEEAEKAKGQLAEIPPSVPDWQFPYTTVVEDDKDVPKKGKKLIKPKSKGEDRTDLKQMSVSGIERAVPKLQKAETGKAGEILPGKGQDLSETKDVKPKRRGSVHPDAERRLSVMQEKEHVSIVEKLVDKKEESKKMKAKIEGKSESVVPKSAEMKRRRSVIKGAGKEASELSQLHPLPPIKEKQQLPESTEVGEEVSPEALDKSPEEMLSPDSKRRKTEITPSPELSIKEEDENLPVSDEKASPLLSEVEVDVSTGREETMGESEIRPSSGMTPAPVTIRILEGTPAAVLTPEKLFILEKEIPGSYTDSLGFREVEIKDLINENMLQLADHLTELKGMPEAETVAKLLLEPGKGTGETEDERMEKKRKLFGNIASTLQLLQQTQVPEAGQSEKERNEMAEKRRVLLLNLESDLKDLQPTQAVEHGKEDIDREINKLSEDRNLLLESLESNMKDLKEAQALAATEPSEMNESKVKELLQQREELTANLEANLKDLHKVKALELSLAEKDKYAKEISDLSEQRNILLENLKINLKELEEAEVLAATQPGNVSDGKIKGLQEQRKHLASLLDTSEQDLQRARAGAPGLADESNLQEITLSVLSEKRKLLQEKLDSNLKDLQEAQMLASLQPDSVNERKVEELMEQRKMLMDDLKAAVNDMLEMQHHPSQKVLLLRPSERELSKIHKLSEKKQLLLEKLESNQRELEEAQELAFTQPGSISAHKLQELSEQRKHLTADLEATLDYMERIYCRASERTIFVQPARRELDELSEKKQELLEKLELNRKELQQAQELAILQPGSVSDHKLQTLFNQRRHLTEELETTMHDLQKAQDLTLESTGTIWHTGRELYELSAKKHEIMEKLKSNLKELQEAQELAATQPGSISESKLQELVEQRRCLTQDLEDTLRDIVKEERLVSERALIGRPAEKELCELSAKKELLQSYLDSNWKVLQEAQSLASAQPDSISEQKVQELAQERRQLTADLEATIQEIHEAERHASEGALIEQSLDRELYDLFEKKHLLQANLESKWKEIQEAQALEAAHPGSISEHKLEELAQERQHLTEDLEKTLQDIQKVKLSSSRRGPVERPTERELYELSEKKKLLLENLKELQEAQAVAATQPGIVGEIKQKQLAEQKRRLAADLEATMHDIEKAQCASEMPVTLQPNEKELCELLEKKYLLLENLASNRKELQEAHALADAQPDSVSDHKLQVLTEQRKHLTEDLKAIVQDIQEIEHLASQRALVERELFDLSEKKELLMESLQSKQKELQEATALAASQPGTISDHKLQELAEQKRQLVVALEATVRDIREIQRRTSQRTLPEKPCEDDLHKLFEWKQLLLEHVEPNLKELEEAHALIATEPDSICEKKIQELNEQRKILTENLEAAVHDMQEIKAHFSETGGVIRPIEKDLNQLFQQKKLFLELLELNLEELQTAQKLAATHPGHMNEKKVQELTEERRLLAAAVEAIVQDLEDDQEVVGTRGRERILEELSEKRRVFLHNLASNMKDLKQAQALAAAQPDGISEQKVQELTEQRRLLAVGLDAIMQEIKSLILDTGEILKPTEREVDLAEKKRLALENLELNLEELRDLQATVSAEPDGMSEQKRQELSEKRELLAADIESVLQDMQEAQVSYVDQSVMTRTDEKNINDLIVLSRLESKLDKLEGSGTLSSVHWDSIRKKVHHLKEQKRSLVDKRIVPVIEHPEAYAVDNNIKEKAVQGLVAQRKNLFSYLQSSIRDLQEKGIIRQSSTPDRGLRDISKEKIPLDQYIVAVPIHFLQSDAPTLSDKYRQDDEKTTKQRVLAAKLEANIKDLQAAFEGEKMEKTRYIAPRDLLGVVSKRRIILTEPTEHQLFKPSLSGLQIQISKIPVTKKSKPGHTSSHHRKAEIEFNAAVQDQQDKLLQKEIELAFKKQFTPSESRTSLPQLPSPTGSDISPERHPVDIALQEVRNFYKTVILGQKANLQQTLQTTQQQLQQQLQQQPPPILAEKLRHSSVFSPQPPGTTRFHEYSLQPSKAAWESNQLPQKDYIHKLNILRRKLLGPEVKALWETPSAHGTSSPTNQSEKVDSIVICGKGVNPKKKQGAFPVIKQNLRHN